jgi:hypothetical protein
MCCTSSTHILAFKLQSKQLSDQLVKHKELVGHGCTLYSVLVFGASTGALQVIENA